MPDQSYGKSLRSGTGGDLRERKPEFYIRESSASRDQSPQGSGGVLQGAGQVSGTVLQAAAAPLWDPAEEDREELSVSDGAGHLDGFRCAGYP